MKLLGKRVARQFAFLGLCAAFSGWGLAQTAYLPTQPIYTQFSSVRTPLEMQARLVVLLQEGQQPASVVVSNALASGMSPSQVLRATSASASGKLSDVVTSLVIATQSTFEATSLMGQINLFAPAQLSLALRSFAEGNPELLPAAVASSVFSRPNESSENIAVAMAAASEQEDGAALVKLVHASAVQANPSMSASYTALGISFTSGGDAQQILELGILAGGIVGASADSPLNCPVLPVGKQPNTARCIVSDAVVVLANSARLQQRQFGPGLEIKVAEAVAQLTPLQGLVGGGLVGGATAGPGLLLPTALVGTSSVDPNLVSTGTTP